MGMDTQFVFPTIVPTFDCTEIAHIQNLGGGLAKFWFAGQSPIMFRNHIVTERIVTMALIFPLSGVPRAARMSLSAAASFALLAPEDFMGEPAGHG